MREIGITLMRQSTAWRELPSAKQPPSSIQDVFDGRAKPEPARGPELQTSTDYGARAFSPFVSADSERPKPRAAEEVQLSYRTHASCDIAS